MTDYIKILYVSGPPTIPLLVQTIRQNLKEKVKRFPNNDAWYALNKTTATHTANFTIRPLPLSKARKFTTDFPVTITGK